LQLPESRDRKPPPWGGVFFVAGCKSPGFSRHWRRLDRPSLYPSAGLSKIAAGLAL